MSMGEKTKKLWSDPVYRKKMSDAHKGKIHAGSFKKGHKVSNTGKTWIKKGQFSGEKNYFYGKKFIGEINEMWKGDKVGYQALHSWLYREFGKPTKCENKKCFYPRKNKRGILMKKPLRFEWANLGTYDRDRKNWVMLCSSCHGILDKSEDKFLIKL